MTLPEPQRQPRLHGVDGDGGVSPELAGVSVTMLWALHNRAAEAGRPDGALVDPGSLRIHRAIDYDFSGQFGDPVGSLAARAAEIDRVLAKWLERHPEGQVVSLGEGLETQAHRVDNGRMRWLSVDLPDALRLRERFLAPTLRFRHIAASALDPAWMDEVDPSSGVFVIAQGLLMYLDPEPVRRLFVGLADRFPGAEIVFDTVPRWFSQLTVSGLDRTASYRLPPMPWGIDRDEVEPTLRGWHPGIADFQMLDYRSPRGLPRLVADVMSQVPLVRDALPSLVHVRVAERRSASSVDAEETSLAADALRPDETPMPWTTAMTDNHTRNSRAETLDIVLSMARENARRGGDIVAATRHVIAKRVALGFAAAFDPLHADHDEFARMAPEKVKAFSTSGMVMMRQAGEATRQMIRSASREAATARAPIALRDYASLPALAAAQGRFARACLDRAASSLIDMGMLALSVQAAAMEPIRATVVGNAERLGRPGASTAPREG